jgi:hypothetical protein
MKIARTTTTAKNHGTLRKICSHATPSTTNLTLTGLGFNPDLQTEKSVNDLLSHSTIFYHQRSQIMVMKMAV